MTQPPSDPRLSATILLLREREALEVLMVVRHYQIDFAAGALVFPGGKVVENDHSEEWTGRVDGAFTGAERAARIGAVRETFEESGLLLARPVSARGPGAALVDGEVSSALAPHRAAVDKGEKAFSDLMAENDLVLALDTLIHFGHWITPEMMPKRFDTHFYLAPAPKHQVAVHDGRETTDAVWVNPHKALEMETSGEATIIFPTRMNLIKLARADDLGAVDRLYAGAKVVKVLPVVDRDEAGKPCLRIPEEAGYGVTLEPLERVKV